MQLRTSPVACDGSQWFIRQLAGRCDRARSQPGRCGNRQRSGRAERRDLPVFQIKRCPFPVRWGSCSLRPGLPPLHSAPDVSDSCCCCCSFFFSSTGSVLYGLIAFILSVCFTAAPPLLLAVLFCTKTLCYRMTWRAALHLFNPWYCISMRLTSISLYFA